MNTIIAPITPCGNAGYDQYNQFWVYWQEGRRKVGTILLDPRGKSCAICGRGWELTVDSIRDQQWVDAPVPLLAHARCMHGYRSMRERFRIEALLGDRDWLYEVPTGLVAKEVPNSYSGEGGVPWFLLEFPKVLPGVELLIGQRKRVWHVELRNLNDERCATVADALLTVTDTKGREGRSVYVHCWDEAQLKERVRLMMAAIAPEHVRKRTGKEELV